MRTKQVNRESVEFKKALNDASKEEDMRGIYVKIPFSRFKKLKEELFKLRLPMSKWILSKIEEIK